jgi:hypothetical protein
MALIRSQGEPLSLREAAPPPVPDDQNAAPLYEEGFHRLPRLQHSFEPGVLKQPRLSPADESVLDRFLSEDASEPRKGSLQEVRHALAGTDTALALVRRAAAMPRCRYAVNWEAGAGALFPHYPVLISVSRLLAAHAILAATDGKPAEAAADLHASVRISCHVASEPVMIGQVVAYRCFHIAQNSLRRVMEITPLSEADSNRLYQDLAAVDLYRLYAHSVLTERCFGLWAFDLVRRDPAKLMRALKGDDQSLPWQGLGLLGAPLLKMDEVWYLRCMAKEAARAKAQHQVWPAGTREEEPAFPWYTLISRELVPAISGVTRRRDEAIAGLDLAEWGLALQVYQQHTGHYPESLAEAERSVGWKPPRDPFTGEALTYRRQGSGYLLYSWGLNGQDNHGQNRTTSCPPGTAPPPGLRSQEDQGQRRIHRPYRAGSPPFQNPDDIAWRFD